MREFAQVEIDPKDAARKYVHYRFTAAVNPYPSTVDIRDVTDAAPQPAEGWTANDNGTYSAPPAAAQTVRRDPHGQRRALVRAKADALVKSGKHLEAMSLRATIGE